MAKDSPELSEAGENFATSALIVSKAVKNVLLPIAAVNFAFDKGREYFENSFQKDLEKMAENIPPENIVEPDASVAAGALQGLAFSHGENALKEMYLALIATAMDKENKENAHPAFAEIIKQLSGVEAAALSSFLKNADKQLPICEVRQINKIDRESYTLLRHLLDWQDMSIGGRKENPQGTAMVENWRRLGLVEVDYTKTFVASGAYDWIPMRSEVTAIQLKDGFDIRYVKGILYLTDFGKSFADAVSASSAET